MVPLIVDLWNT